MPGTGKTQPAAVRARGFRGQNTVECHAGLDAVREKTVQPEQENPGLNQRGMIDDFRLRGSHRCQQMGGHLSEGGGGH